VSASARIAAPPERVWSLIADLPRMGEWSPETARVTWLDGATRAVPGARFAGHNRIGKLRRWSTKGTVVVADPGRELTFDISSLFGLPVARWSYQLEPEGVGCRVTEWTEERRGRLILWAGILATGVRDRATHNQENIRTTLERLKAAAEAGGS
jgi:uncharacterized protein YndB with AHSA1/START domain